MTAQIKITQLTNIGSANTLGTSLLPIVNMTGVPTTQKTTLGNLANVILSQSGGNYAPAGLANLSYSVTNAAQPNITSVGTLTGLNVSGNANIANLQFVGSNIATPVLNGNIYINGNGPNGHVQVTANSFNWTFDPNGNMTLSDGTTLGPIGSNSSLGFDVSSNMQFQIQTNNGGNLYNWYFNKNGSMIFPAAGNNEATIQSYTDAGQGSFVKLVTSASANFILGTSGNNHVVINTNKNGSNTRWIFDDVGNLTLPGNTWSVYYANGTLVPISGGDSYGNSNVATYLASYGSNTITTTGNVSVGNIIGNGQALTGIAGANVSGFVPNANVANTAFAVAAANVTGLGNIATINLTGSTSNVLYGNGVFAAVAGGGNTGNVTFDDVTVQGVNGLNLSAGADFTANLAYLQIRAGDFPSHIHFDTGNNQAYDLIVGDDQKFVQVSSTGNILMSSYDGANSYQWNMDTTGNLNLPTNGNINFDGGGITQAINKEFNIVVQDEEDDGWSIFNTITDGLGNYLSQTQLDSGSFTIGTASGGNTYSWSFSGNTLQVSTNSQIRSFGSNMALQAMSSGSGGTASLQSISNTNDPNIFTTFDATTTGANITVYNGGSNGGTGNTWRFDNTGVLTVPGEGIIQSIQDTIILQSVDANSNVYSARLGTNGGLYFATTQYPQGWLDITNNSGNANITAASGTAGGAGKNMYITAGAADQSDFYTTSGGSVNLTGGLGASDDGGGGGPGGNVNIASGLSADPAGHAGNINITAGSNDWIFDYNGDLTVPGNLVYIGASPAPSISGFSSVSAEEFTNDTSNVTINANSNTWTFGTNGNLTVPGNIVFNSNVYINTGYTISANTDIGGQVQTSNHTMAYFADNNTTAGIVSYNNIDGTTYGSVTTNGTGGNVTVRTGTVALTRYDWVFGGAGVLQSPVVVYANLPAATTAGLRAFISDANLVASGNFGNAVSGGGSNTVSVWSNGTNWLIG